MICTMDSISGAEQGIDQQPIILTRATLEAAKNYWDSIRFTPEEAALMRRSRIDDPKRGGLSADVRHAKQSALQPLTRIAPELVTFLQNDGNPKWTAIDSVTLTPDRLYALEVYLTESIKAERTGQQVVWDINDNLTNTVPNDFTDVEGHVLHGADAVQNFKERTGYLSSFLEHQLGLGEIVNKCEAIAQKNLDSNNGVNPPTQIHLAIPK